MDATDFKKTCEASAEMSYTLTDADVSNWDVASKAWKVTKGEYKVYACTSSQDCPLTTTLTV